MSLFRTEKQKMLAGELYNPNDAELEADRDAAGAWMVRYSAAVAASDADRHALGSGAIILPGVITGDNCRDRRGPRRLV